MIKGLGPALALRYRRGTSQGEQPMGASALSGPPAHPRSAGIAAQAHAVTVFLVNFKVRAQPPFNVEARNAAGFTGAWYEPLAAEPRRRDAPAGAQAEEGAAAVVGSAG